MNFFGKHRLRKRMREVRQALHHALHWREDIGAPEDVAEARRMLDKLKAVRREKAWGEAAAVCEAGAEAALRLFPPRANPRWRENVELLVVALGLAMTCRTYFVQPFKIPTGSMQPTLNGITGVPLGAEYAAWYKNPLLKLFPLAFLGERYVELRTKSGGRVEWNTNANLVVGGREYETPVSFIRDTRFMNPERSLELHVAPGERVPAGALLASGIRKLGDHVLVNKMAYHFRKPRRGDVVVFETNGIDEASRHQHRIASDTFYIKRLVGLGGETISLADGYLLVDGDVVVEPAIFKTIADDPVYAGYALRQGSLLERPGDVIELGESEFLPFGDNTYSSLDGRYFGGIDTRWIVGPAVAVYWPFGAHWGRIP